MKIYIVWYYNPELSTTAAAMWGIYATRERAEQEIEQNNLNGHVNEETVEE